MTKIWRPSAAGTGPWKFIGPNVNCASSRPARGNRPVSSLNAQMFDTRFCKDSNTKYLPSADQLPQHSPSGLFQPGSKGCGLVPSAATSHSLDGGVLASPTVKRNWPPSGDQRGQ